MLAPTIMQEPTLSRLALGLTLTTRVFRRPLLLPTPRVIEYSNDVVFLFHPAHLLYHLHDPLPDNSMMIVIVVSVWIVLFM